MTGKNRIAELDQQITRRRLWSQCNALISCFSFRRTILIWYF